MKKSYFKARVPASLHEAACARAGREGLRLGTYLREAVERDLEVKTPAIAPVQATAIDHEARALLQEIRALVRELAMASNAQIVARVAAQLKTQPHSSI